MRILHTESSLGWGGQEIRVLTESQGLINLGHQVSVLADQTSLIAQRAARFEVPIAFGEIAKKRPVAIHSLIRAIDAFRPDVISTHSSTDHWAAAISRKFSRCKPRIVRTRHVSTPVHRNVPARWLYRSGCEAIVTTGESIRRNLVSDNFVEPHKVFSIPTGIDLEFFCSATSDDFRNQAKERLIRKHDLQTTDFIFGTISTLRSWKGHHDLIKAYASALEAMPKSKLLIVGDGPQARSIEKLAFELNISDCVIFCGYQDDIRDYLESFNFFVFPSFANEGVPQAILQAMAYGLPIITTRAGSIEEAIGNYSAVTYVAERDTISLSKALTDIAARQETRLQLTESIAKRINIRTMIDRMEKLYQGLPTSSGHHEL